MSILERIKSHSDKLTDADRRLVTTLLLSLIHI